MLGKHRIYYIILITAVIVSLSAFTTGFFVFSSSTSLQAQCAQFINKKLPTNANIVTYSDSHNGFLSDGEMLTVIKLTDVEERDFIYGQGIYASWNVLNRSLNETLFGTGEFTDFYQKIPFHEINRGYYFINDKQEERNKNKPEQINGIFNRNAVHFTMGIYDMENNLLYVYALDINRNVTPNYNIK